MSKKCLNYDEKFWNDLEALQFKLPLHQLKNKTASNSQTNPLPKAMSIQTPISVNNSLNLLVCH